MLLFDKEKIREEKWKEREEIEIIQDKYLTWILRLNMLSKLRGST